jgi:hypothetical protein
VPSQSARWAACSHRGTTCRWHLCWRGSCAPRALGTRCCDTRHRRRLSAWSEAVAVAETPLAALPSVCQGVAACSHPLATGAAGADDGGAADGAQACGSAREDGTSAAACAWEDGGGDDGGFGGDDGGWTDGGGARIAPGGGRRAARRPMAAGRLRHPASRQRFSSAAIAGSPWAQARRQCPRRCRPVQHTQRAALHVAPYASHLQFGDSLSLADHPRSAQGMRRTLMTRS